MTDDQEIKCIVALIHALRGQSEQNNGSSETETRKRQIADLSIEDRSEKIRSRRKQSPIALPDAVIRHGILSYQPFRPFRVVLIRGEEDGIQWNDGNHQNLGGGGFSLRKKREYSLTFGSNRGPLRFQVVELPYLPATNRNNKAEAETYRSADGVIISCYMSKFFEFCDRYGYHYASTSILEDIMKRRIEEHTNYALQDDDDGVLAQQDWKRARTATKRKPCKEYPNSIVLCSNNVDITHVDARLSSIVFREPRMEPAPTNVTGSLRDPPTCFIETPKQPFSSLARSLTCDDGLEFVDVTANSFTCREDLKEAGDPHGLLTNQEQHQHFEKYTCSNDEDLCNWNWLRAQVSS